MKAQLDNGVEIDDSQIGLQLTKLKPVYVGWIVEFCNYMKKERKSAGIFDALELGLSKMLSINPFQGVDTMLSNDAEQYDDSCLLAICDFTAEEFEASYGSKIQESDDSTESKWEEAEN